LTSLNLEPQKGDKILDCCAAPGNKTIHLGELSEGTGEIVAVDRSKRRLKQLQEKVTEFQIENIRPIVGDITKLSKEWTVKFDKILVDPPCTALGLRPRLVLETNRQIINSTADYQKAILFACEKLLKPGGELIYSTCTITKEENEDVMEWVENLNFEIVDHKYRVSRTQVLDSSRSTYFQRFLPGKDRTLGYFIAKLKKKQR
jgi:16S rRNA C967 or C1407 C5-methylase (RsmB/RsmF family)